MALLGVENSDEHQLALRGLGNGECIFRDLEGRAGRIGIDLISDEMRQWLDTNPTRSKPAADGPRVSAEAAPGAEPGAGEPPEARPGAEPGGRALNESAALFTKRGIMGPWHVVGKVNP